MLELRFQKNKGINGNQDIKIRWNIFKSMTIKVTGEYLQQKEKKNEKYDGKRREDTQQDIRK